MTAPLFISEPVAGSVSTVAKGTVPAAGLPVSTISQASPSYNKPAEISLVPSMTDPPPTANKIDFLLFTQAIALRRVSIEGLGSIPQNSTVL